MSYKFKQAGKRKLGYEISQVDSFLDLARKQYENKSATLVNATDISSTRFELVRNGYSIPVVDAAMEKLEDVFAAEQYGRDMNLIGYFEFKENFSNLENLVQGRLSARRGKRFKKRRWPNRGYSKKQVNVFCSQLAKLLENKNTISVKELRTVTFRSKRGGYAEYQVDAFIEKVVELLQRQQVLEKTGR
jgi:DivIVA domain-containing protein